MRSRVRTKGGPTWAPEDSSYLVTWIVPYREIGQPTFRRRGGSGAIRVGVECRREAECVVLVGSLGLWTSPVSVDSLESLFPSLCPRLTYSTGAVCRRRRQKLSGRFFLPFRSATTAGKASGAAIWIDPWGSYPQISDD